MEFLLLSARKEGLVRSLVEIRKLPCHWLWLRLGDIHSTALNYPEQQLSWQNLSRREYGELLKELPESSECHVPEQSQLVLQGHLSSWTAERIWAARQLALPSVWPRSTFQADHSCFRKAHFWCCCDVLQGYLWWSTHFFPSSAFLLQEHCELTAQ